ncbi:MAG: lamin tail domain-containing protein [Vicinamibacterales bacterium]
MSRLVKLCVVTLLVCVAAVGSRAQGTPAVFINELHYDNTGTDAGEFIEIAGPAGTNLADYSIVLYNGASGAPYDTDVLSGTIPNQQGGFGTAVLSYPSNGIQNGSLDGIALVYQGTVVVQFLSYEGAFTAVGGAATGMLSTDIGVSENGSGPVGESLRLAGTGSGYSDFTWQPSAAASPGSVNAGQTFTGGTTTATLFLDDAYVTEGNSGQATAVFTVTVTGAHSGITFDIATSDGTGTSPATVFDSDYVSHSLSGQAIASPDTTYTFEVLVNGDTQFEAEEEFIVSLTNVSGASVLRGVAVGSIGNDDAPPPDTTDVVISQVYGGGGNAGAVYTHDFIELFNPTAVSVDLTGWSVQYTSASGAGTWQVTPLSGTIAAGGYYLIQEAAGAAGTTPLPAADAVGGIGMAAGAGKVALRLDTAAFAGACPAFGEAADLVGYGGATCFEGAAPSSALSNTLAAFRKRGGCFDSDDNRIDFSASAPAPRNGASPARSCTFTSTTIHEIQGDGAITPLLGQDVSTTGIVTARKANGFFMQTVGDDDLDPATSQGLFVFTSQAPGVAVGDSVTARGTASEFFNLTQLESSLPGDVTVESSGNPVPPAVTLTSALVNPAGGADQLESFEGMRMHADTLVAVAPTNDFGEIFTVLPGVPRPMREPGIEQSATVPPDPSSLAVDCCIPRWDENRERIMIDSDGLAGATVLNVTTGVLLSAVTGPLDFSFSNYKVLPESAPLASANQSAVPVPVPAADEFTVAGFNVENFRNDETQRRKAALAIRQVLHYPDVLGHVEILDLASLQALAAQVNADAVAAGDPDPGYEAHLVPASPSATQNVGFLVKTSRVQVDSVTQEGAGETYINPLSGNPETLHDRPPLVLRATAVLPGLTPRPVIVVVNHLRSFIDIELVGGDGLRVRAKRTAQAESTANLLQTLQFTNPGVPVISIGDYNAYEFNDGYTDPIAVITGAPTPDDQVVVDESPDLVNPDFVNLTNSLPAGERYTFVFEGTPQALDHVLVNTAGASLVSRYAVARNNADFPEGALFAGDVTRPERNSDHDMPVAYFRFSQLADLSVAAAGPASPVTTGGAFSYTVSVTNNGPDPALDVTVSIPAQAGVRFSAVAAPAGWTCVAPAPGATGAVSCSASALAAGVVESIAITALLDCGIGDGAVLSQMISVGGSLDDPSPADNAALVSVIAANPPPLITGVITPITVPPVPGAARAGAVVADSLLGTVVAADNCGATVARSGVPAGNLFPVGSTTVTYTAVDSGGATATATSVVTVLNAEESLQAIAVDLQAVIAASTKPALTRRAQDALRAVQRAIAQLQDVPPDHLRAVAFVTVAIGEVEEISRKRLLSTTVAKDLLKRLTGASWLLARQDLELAIASEGQSLNNLIASRLLAEANKAASAGRCSLASTLYWLVVGFAQA